MLSDRKDIIGWAVLVAGVLLTVHCSAHDQVPGKTQSRPILIVGATIHPIDRPAIPDGILLFENGLIRAVGSTLGGELPANTLRIDAVGKHVYPGLIAGMSEIGLREIAAVNATIDENEIGATNPNVRSWVAVNPDSELIPVARANGVLIAHISPTGERMQGQSAVMQLDGWTAKEMILKAPAGLCIEWDSIEPTGKNNASRIDMREKNLKELDDLWEATKRYSAALDASEKANARGSLDGKTRDLILESLIPVVKGEARVFVEANRKAAIESAVAYTQSRNMKLTIYGGYDAVSCAALLKRFDVSVIIPGTFREPLHPHDAFDAPYTLPYRLHKAGVKFCISGEHAGYPGGATNLRNLPYQAARAVAYGLSHEDGLRSVTLSAAEILGVENEIGSLSVGKHATLIICAGDILEVGSHVTHAWIQGKEVDLGSRHRMLFEKYEKKYSTNSLGRPKPKK